MHPEIDYPPPAPRSLAGQLRALGVSLGLGLLATVLAAAGLNAISLSGQSPPPPIIGTPKVPSSAALFIKRGAPKRTLLPQRPPAENIAPPIASPLLSPIVIEWVPFDEDEEFPLVGPFLWGWREGWEV